MPWRGVVAWGGVPPYQSQWTLSALGPTTAIDLSARLLRGSAPPAFFSSTIDWRAIVLEISRCSGLAQGAGPSLGLAYGTISGGSSSPSFSETRNLRRSASSRSASVTRPSFSAARSSSRALSRYWLIPAFSAATTAAFWSGTTL
jgi:hypothetical protein